MKRLIYTGRESPWRDIRGFVERAKAQYPKLQSPQDVRHLVTRVTNEVSKSQRAKYLYIFIPGLDILADDIATIACWGGLSSAKRAQLLSLGMAGREQLLADRQSRTEQRPLSRSYAWCQANGWIQEVDDVDYDLIMATSARKVFRDPDLTGPFVPAPRAYDGEELFPFTQVPVTSFKEAEQARRFHGIRGYTAGAELARGK